MKTSRPAGWPVPEPDDDQRTRRLARWLLLVSVLVLVAELILAVIAARRSLG